MTTWEQWVENLKNSVSGLGNSIYNAFNQPITTMADYDNNKQPTPTISQYNQPTTAPAYTPAPVPPTPTPTPTAWADVTKYNDPASYTDLINQIWKGVPSQDVIDTMQGESGGRIGAYNLNDVPNGWGKAIGVNIPDTRTDWLNLRKQYESVDVGLMMLNTADAMTEYLDKKGWTYYDLLHDPVKNLTAAYDLYSGNIPKTSKGWGNWNGRPERLKGKK